MPNQQRLVALLVAVLGYAIKFIAYNFLTPVILLSFAALMFAYITLVGPEMPFLRYLSFLLPVSGRGNASINEEDIMKVYGFLTMALFVLSVAGGWLIRVLTRAVKRAFQSELEGGAADSVPVSQNLLSSGKRRLLISNIAIAIIYLIVFAVIPFARMAEGTNFLAMYPLFVVFGVIAVVSNAIYIGIDSLSEFVLGWAWARVLSGQESI